MPLDIIIVGGGIGGLAAAAFLREHHNVTVLERSPIGSDDRDYGLSVVANAFGLLQKQGIKLENLDTVVMTHVWIRNHKNEIINTILFDTRSRFGGAPSVLLKRRKLLDELKRLATSPGDVATTLTFRHERVVKVDADNGTVTTQEGDVLRGDLIIGADGINSIVRATVLQDHGSATSPRTHDLMLFLAEVPIEAVRDDPELSFLAEPEKQAGLTTCYPPDGSEAKSRMLIYHVSPRALQVIGYTAEKEFAKLFDSTKTSIIRDIPASRVIDELSADFPKSFVNLFTHGKIDAWRIKDVPPIDKWYRGKAVLLGDAAHAVTPHAGQGCNITIEDAEALGVLLKDVQSSADVPAALETYVTLRKERAEFVSRRSREIGNIQSDDDKAHDPIGSETFVKAIYGYQGAEAALQELRSRQLSAPA